MIEEGYYSIRHKSNQPHLMEGTAWQSWQWSVKQWDNRGGHLVSHMISPWTLTLLYFDVKEHVRWLRSSILKIQLCTDFGDQIFILENLAFCFWLFWKIKSNNQSLLYPKVWILPAVLLQFKSTFPHFLLPAEIPCHHSGTNFLHVEFFFVSKSISYFL